MMKEYVTKFKNGNLKSKGFKYNKKKEGLWLIYYEKGSIFKEENYLNGVLNGIIKIWHENGNLAIESEYSNGISNGIWNEYYENGFKKEEGHYIKDKYSVRNFWIESNEQTLINGTGYKIEKYGFLEKDIYKQIYENSEFIKEEKISFLNIIENSFLNEE